MREQVTERRRNTMCKRGTTEQDQMEILLLVPGCLGTPHGPSGLGPGPPIAGAAQLGSLKLF